MTVAGVAGMWYRWFGMLVPFHDRMLEEAVDMFGRPGGSREL